MNSNDKTALAVAAGASALVIWLMRRGRKTESGKNVIAQDTDSPWNGSGSFGEYLTARFGANANIAKDEIQQVMYDALLEHGELNFEHVVLPDGSLVYVSTAPARVGDVIPSLTPRWFLKWLDKTELRPMTSKVMDLTFAEEYALGPGKQSRPITRQNIPNVKTLLQQSKATIERYGEKPRALATHKAWVWRPGKWNNHGFHVHATDAPGGKWRGVTVNATPTPGVSAIQFHGGMHNEDHADYSQAVFAMAPIRLVPAGSDDYNSEPIDVLDSETQELVSYDKFQEGNTGPWTLKPQPQS